MIIVLICYKCITNDCNFQLLLILISWVLISWFSLDLYEVNSIPSLGGMQIFDTIRMPSIVFNIKTRYPPVNAFPQCDLISIVAMPDFFPLLLSLCPFCAPFVLLKLVQIIALPSFPELLVLQLKTTSQTIHLDVSDIRIG